LFAAFDKPAEDVTLLLVTLETPSEADNFLFPAIASPKDFRRFSFGRPRDLTFGGATITSASSCSPSS
jgi:hypothetical protein